MIVCRSPGDQGDQSWSRDAYLILEPYGDETVKCLAACDKLELFSRTERANLRADAEKETKKRTLHLGVFM